MPFWHADSLHANVTLGRRVSSSGTRRSNVIHARRDKQGGAARSVASFTVIPPGLPIEDSVHDPLKIEPPYIP